MLNRTKSLRYFFRAVWGHLQLVCVIHERWVIDGEDFEHSSVESIVVDVRF